MILSTIHEDLLAVIDAVEIASPTRYSVQGRARELAEEPAVSGDHPIVPDLARSLYAWLYIRPQQLDRSYRGDRATRREWIAALSRASAARGLWEPGWAVRRVKDDGEIVAARFDVEFWIDGTGHRAGSGTLRDGRTCRVRVPRERRELVPGFYMALGDGSDGDGEDDDRVSPKARYYWHLRADGAVRFLEAATSRLNAAAIPYSLKLPDEPRGHHRADAGVIFVPLRDLDRSREAIAEIHASVARFLGPEVPLFTRRLADGLGFAHDPPGPASFGSHRCRIAARSLWESFLRGERDRDVRAASLASAFRREGLDPLRPHLCSPDSGPHEPEFEVHPAARSIAPPAPAPAAPSTFLDAAIGIGRALCRSAYRDPEGRYCNWTGRTEAEFTEAGGPIIPTLAALGPYLYGGTAGIALFLAHLHAATDDPEFRRTAIGAIANAIRLLRRAPESTPVAPVSFFSGHVGVAYSALQVALRTGCDEMATHAQAMLDRVAAAISAPHLFDVIGGNAGSIPALLAMARSPGFERCRDLALALADELCRTAIRDGATCRWAAERACFPGMCSALSSGISHGAAGVGLALWEAYAETGRADFLETARGAFAYEDTLFDPEAQNWRDLRLPPRDPAFARGWCHGAPGIALARLRAAELDPDHGECYREWAVAGLVTTLAAIEEGLAASRRDASPVNGLTGLIEILFIAGRMLPDDSYRDRAHDAARALIDRHAIPADWPSGAPSGGPNPSLMIGTAGIGYTLLRLHAPDLVPSILRMGAGKSVGPSVTPGGAGG